MAKFLDLTYYHNRSFVFPMYLKLDDDGLRNLPKFYYDLVEGEYGKILFETFYDNNDDILIESLINEHGVFFEKFLALALRHRFNLYFSSEKESTHLLNLCSQNFNVIESRNRLIDRIKTDFLKILVIKRNNISFYNKLLESVKAKSQIKSCRVCGSNFQPICLPDWVYYGSNGNDSICYQCPINSNNDRDELPNLISKLIHTISFIPNANFNPINYNFSSRINRDSWSKVCTIIFKMGVSGNDTLTSNSIFKKHYGSWFKALVDSNVLPNNILKSSRGVRCIAMSGNECNSLDEMYVDNWFYKNNIKTIKEPLYPYHKQYNKSGRRRADWKVNEYFIEYFGLKGEENYDKKTKEKILLANRLNLKLISIFPSDLNNIEKKLSFLLTS
jgi:hypothetical protein